MAVTPAWKFRCELRVDNTKVAADLTNYPVLLEWNGAAATSNLPQIMFDADGGMAAKSAGEDIRFTTDIKGATEVAFEIVRMSTNNNPASAYATIFVKLPNVSSSTPTTFYIWWGNASASAYAVGDTYGRNAVWSAFKSVWHLNQTAGSPVDSAGFSDGTYSGNLPRSAAGKFGLCQDLDGTGDWFDSGNGASYIPNNGSGYGAVYMSCWKKSAMSVTREKWIMKGTHRFGLARDWNGTNYGELEIQPDGGGYGDAIGTVNIANAWSLQAGSYDATNKYRHWTNGAVDGTNVSANGLNTTDTSTIKGGAEGAGSYLMIGQLQELRVYYSGAGGTSFPNAWFSSDYNSQNSPQTFVLVGNPQSAGSAFMAFMKIGTGI